MLGAQVSCTVLVLVSSYSSTVEPLRFSRGYLNANVQSWTHYNPPGLLLSDPSQHPSVQAASTYKCLIASTEVIQGCLSLVCRQDELEAVFQKPGILLTTYGMVQHNTEAFCQMPFRQAKPSEELGNQPEALWDFMILDEV